MSDSSIASADPPREARRHSTLKQHERRVGVALALPALAAFVVVILIPFVKSLKLSLFRYTMDTPEPQFVGFENFVKLFRDPTIVNVCLNTLVFVVSATCVTMLISLAWALMMNQAFKGRALVRAASLLPWVLPSTVTAFLAAWIFNGQYGVLNAILLVDGTDQRADYLAGGASRRDGQCRRHEGMALRAAVHGVFSRRSAKRFARSGGCRARRWV